MKKIERVLIHEDRKQIESAKQSAQARCKKINSLAPVFEFESAKEFTNRTADPDRLVKMAMLQRPELAKLAKNISIDALTIPTDIKQAGQNLDSIKRQYGTSLFDHLVFNGRDWEVSTTALEDYFETQCRVYAIGENQVKRHEAAKNLCEFLNSEKYGFGPFEKANFHNILIEWSLPENKWVPNVRWIVK